MSKKGKRVLASATLMSLVLTTALSAGQVKAAQGKVTRIGEADRYSTAAKVATSNWKTSDNVVLVSGEGYADAVSASALAKKLDAPILLTTQGSLNADAKAALSTLKAKNIYIVGGNASVSQSVRSDLKANYTLVELSGSNRYETNVAVAKKLVELGVKADNVLLVGGEGFSDALSVAPVAAAKGQILLLGCNNADTMKSVVDFVKTNSSKVTVVGTNNVISEDMYKTIGAIDRVNGGASRFDTNLNVLNKFATDLKAEKLYVANATGTGYADALVASALAGKTASPLVLVDTEGSSATTNAINYIKTKSTKTTDLNVVGGTGVVSDATVKAIDDIYKVSTTASTVASIEAVNLNQIKVHFNGAVDSDSAEDVTSYKIDGTQLTPVDDNNKATGANSAVAKAIDDNTVLITLAHPRKQYDKVTVSVKKTILSADKNSIVDAKEDTLTFSDKDLPTLQKVTVEGNSQITVEFSEAVNMKSINELKSKFKIDGQSLSNYSVNTEYSDIKDHIEVTDANYGPKGIWANKVMFYLDSKIESGNHTLKITDGDKDSVLSDAAGFPFKETSMDFSVDSVTTKPAISSIKEVKSGEVHITFDRPMDVQTAKKLTNYKINDKQLNDITGAQIKTTDDDKTIKLKHVGSAIKTGSNTLYVSDSIKDAYGNKVPTDTRQNFDDIKDETKPKVLSTLVVDGETILVRFSKEVSFAHASNTSNYKLVDSKGTDITSHIKGIYNNVSETDKGNADTFKIKLNKYNPADSNDDWRLTGSKYTLTIKNIADTATTANVMDTYVYELNGSDNVKPKATGIYGRKVSGEKNKVIVFFSESMDSATITNKANYQFTNGDGENKTLPSEATISTGGDDKSAIIEFPTSYNVVLSENKKQAAKTGNDNDVLAVIVTNVKDRSGNDLDGISFNNDSRIDKAVAGAKVKNDTLRIKYDSNDLIAEVQFDKAIEEINKEDFRIGGVRPSTARKDGDKAILKFDEDAKIEDGVDKLPKEVAYANKKVNKTPTKIEAIKSQGQDVKLEVNATSTIDEAGALVSTDENLKPLTLSNLQATVYDYQAGPKTTCYKEKDVDFWTAEKDDNGGKVYLTFDSQIDRSSGIRADDFTFVGQNGTSMTPDSIDVLPEYKNTVVFTFKKDNKDFKGFNDSIDVTIKNTLTLTTLKDRSGAYAKYISTSDDIRPRTVKVSGITTPDPKPGTITVTNKPEYNALGYVQVAVNDVTAVDKVYVNGTVKDIAAGFIDTKANTIKIFCDEFSKIELADKAGNKTLAYNPATPSVALTGTYDRYSNTVQSAFVKVNDSSLVDLTKVEVDGKAVDAANVVIDSADKTKLVIKGLAAEPTTIKLTSKDGKVVTIK